MKFWVLLFLMLFFVGCEEESAYSADCEQAQTQIAECGMMSESDFSPYCENEDEYTEKLSCLYECDFTDDCADYLLCADSCLDVSQEVSGK